MHHTYKLPVLLEKSLAHPLIIPVSILLLTVLLAHTFFIPLTPDDYFHKLLLEGHSALELSNPIISFFTFADGNAARTERLIPNLGISWWVDPELRLNFFRPLSAITHWIDHQLWPDNIAFQHIISLIWLFIAAFSLYALYKRIYKNERLALLGFLFFVFCMQLYVAVAWIACRNALLTITFSTLTLLTYYRAITENWTLGFILTPILLGISLLFGEASLSITAFLFAASVCLDQRSRLIAFASLLPSLIVSLVWLFMYQKLGFGAENSGYYIAPQEEPLTYLKRVITSVPILFFSNWINVPPNLFAFKPVVTITTATISILFIITLSYMFLWPLAKKDKIVRFWLLAYIISFLPGCSVPPSMRTLIIPSIACIGLLLSITKHLLEVDNVVSKPKKIFFNSLLFMHLVFPFFAYAAGSFMSTKIERPNLSFNVMSNQNALTNDDHLFVISTEALQTASAVTDALLKNRSVPANVIDLISPSNDFWISRPKKNQLIFESKKHRLIYATHQTNFNWLIRHFANKPLKQGTKVKISDFNIEILKSSLTLGPTKISLTTPKSINDKNYKWLLFLEKQRIYKELILPKVGETIKIPFYNLRSSTQEI